MLCESVCGCVPVCLCLCVCACMCVCAGALAYLRASVTLATVLPVKRQEERGHVPVLRGTSGLGG